TSAEVTNVHSPLGQSVFASVNTPLLFVNSRGFDHSRLTTNSGNPSEFRSEKTAPVTKPISRKMSDVFWSRANALPSYRYKKLEPARGYSPGIQRPPTNNSSELSPLISATARHPIITFGTLIVCASRH